MIFTGDGLRENGRKGRMSGDLISRSALLSKMTDRTFRSELHEYRHYQNTVKMMPTAYNVDKVVEQLEQQKNQYFRRAEEIKNKFGENYESQKNYGKACSYDHAIEIVKSSGIE